MEMQQVGVDPNDLRVQSRQWCTAHVRDGSDVGNFYQKMAIEKAVQRLLGFMAYRRKSKPALMAA